jgi:hypothetical protein
MKLQICIKNHVILPAVKLVKVDQQQKHKHLQLVNTIQFQIRE